MDALGEAFVSLATDLLRRSRLGPGKSVVMNDEMMMGPGAVHRGGAGVVWRAAAYGEASNVTPGERGGLVSRSHGRGEQFNGNGERERAKVRVPAP